MKSKKLIFVYIILYTAFIIFWVKFNHVRDSICTDPLKPNYEFDTMYRTPSQVPAEHLDFYDNARYMAFRSPVIDGDRYELDFTDIPFNSLKGYPEEYRYYIDQGNVYEKCSANKNYGKYTALLVLVEKTKLFNQEIQIQFDCSEGQLYGAYAKLVYLSLDGNKTIKFVPLEPSENQIALNINSNLNSGFLKAIYIFYVTKEESNIHAVLKDHTCSIQMH
ncbi:MAG: hypothetical protein J6B94_08345 [Lachnospiraceae bacterium]|nr:hypothetical protein [Lachnospiraceae bacterium]